MQSRATNAPHEQGERTPEEREIVNEYKSGVASLIAVLEERGGHFPAEIEKLRAFEHRMVEGVNAHFSGTGRALATGQLFQGFKQCCALAQDSHLNLDARRRVIADLSQGLSKCTEGVALNIEEAVLELNALKGLSELFLQRVEETLNTLILDAMPKFERGVAGNEIHCVAAVFNRVAPMLGLPLRVDDYADRFSAQQPENVKRWAEQVEREFSVEQVIKGLAESCLSRIREFYAEEHPEIDLRAIEMEQLVTASAAFQEKLQGELAHSYCVINSGDLFAMSEVLEDGYALVTGTAAIERSLARVLGSLNLIESVKPVEIAVNRDGAVIHKLKVIGSSIAYVSQRTVQDEGAEKMDARRVAFQQLLNEDSERAAGLLADVERQMKAGSAGNNVAGARALLRAGVGRTPNEEFEFAVRFGDLERQFDLLGLPAGDHLRRASSPLVVAACLRRVHAVQVLLESSRRSPEHSSRVVDAFRNTVNAGNYEIFDILKYEIDRGMKQAVSDRNVTEVKAWRKGGGAMRTLEVFESAVKANDVETQLAWLEVEVPKLDLLGSADQVPVLPSPLVVAASSGWIREVRTLLASDGGVRAKDEIVRDAINAVPGYRKNEWWELDRDSFFSLPAAAIAIAIEQPREVYRALMLEAERRQEQSLKEGNHAAVNAWLEVGLEHPYARARRIKTQAERDSIFSRIQ